MLQGATTYWDPQPSGHASVYFQNVNVDVPVPIASDPRPAVLEWLAAIEASPFVPEEYVPNPERDTSIEPGGFTAGFVRMTIGETPFEPAAANQEGFSASVKAHNDVWRILSLVIYPAVALATEQDARKLRECTPDAPPSEAAIRTHTFEGLEFANQCAERGTYEYTPNAKDRSTWGNAPWVRRPSMAARSNRQRPPLLDPGDWRAAVDR